MPRQALAKHDLPRVIHPYRVKHVLCEIDPEDGHLLLHGTHLLWLNGFPNLLELIVAHCRRSAQGRVHFITTGLSGCRISRKLEVQDPLNSVSVSPDPLPWPPSFPWPSRWLSRPSRSGDALQRGGALGMVNLW